MAVASERSSAFGSPCILSRHKSLSEPSPALHEWYILFTLQRKIHTVHINHLPPLIMSHLPLIHHHYQSHASREAQWLGEKNKHGWLARWLFQKGYVKHSKLRHAHSDGIRSQYCNVECGDFRPGDFSYLVCHSLSVKYRDDMRTFLLPDMFI